VEGEGLEKSSRAVSKGCRCAEKFDWRRGGEGYVCSAAPSRRERTRRGVKEGKLALAADNPKEGPPPEADRRKMGGETSPFDAERSSWMSSLEGILAVRTSRGAAVAGKEKKKEPSPRTRGRAGIA